MPREVDERKTRRALNRVRRAKGDAEQRGEELSGWESEFVESVETRLKTFGSAFNDPEKGDLSEPLSGRQRLKLNEVAKKAKGAAKAKKPPKPRKPLRARKPMNRGKGFGAKTKAPLGRPKPRRGEGPRVRDINDDIPEEERSRFAGPPKLRVVRDDED